MWWKRPLMCPSSCMLVIHSLYMLCLLIHSFYVVSVLKWFWSYVSSSPCFYWQSVYLIVFCVCSFVENISYTACLCQRCVKAFERVQRLFFFVLFCLDNFVLNIETASQVHESNGAREAVGKAPKSTSVLLYFNSVISLKKWRLWQ